MEIKWDALTKEELREEFRYEVMGLFWNWQYIGRLTYAEMLDVLESTIYPEVLDRVADDEDQQT